MRELYGGGVIVVVVVKGGLRRSIEIVKLCRRLDFGN